MKKTSFAWLLGGALWLVAGLTNNGTHEAIWLAADAFIAFGIFGLWNADLHAGKRLGAVGLALVALGRAAFVVAEIAAVASGNDENAMLPAGAILTAIGMTMYGVEVIRSRRLSGPAAIAPLLAGIYPFAAMFPIVAATGEPSTVAIALWGIPLGLIGLAFVGRPSTATAAAP
jgi:hypothetical protein